MTRGVFVEDDVPGEVIFTCKVTDMPAYPVVFVAHEDGFISTRTGFGTEFRRNGWKTLAPPYS